MTTHAPFPAAGPIPVICDRCRAEGFAGVEGFAEIRDLLSFEPVPRRAHADGWRPELQRAFIAALAITGSPRRAARAIGRAAFGAEQLRRARGGRGFAEAWDAALELYRERELMRLDENLAELAREQKQREALHPGGGGGGEEEDDYDEGEDGAIGSREVREVRARIRDRLLRARRLFLLRIHEDAERRAAWEALCGPVDWDKASRCEPQDNEPWCMPAMREPDMLIPAEHGYIAEATGGYDHFEALRRGLAEVEARKAAGLPPFPEEGEEEGREGGEVGGA